MTHLPRYLPARGWDARAGRSAPCCSPLPRSIAARNAIRRPIRNHSIKRSHHPIGRAPNRNRFPRSRRSSANRTPSRSFALDRAHCPALAAPRARIFRPNPIRLLRIPRVAPGRIKIIGEGRRSTSPRNQRTLPLQSNACERPPPNPSRTNKRPRSKNQQRRNRRAPPPGNLFHSKTSEALTPVLLASRRILRPQT